MFNVRVGQHPAECYDRINFDLNGPDAVGYFADYVPADQVVTEGEGAPAYAGGHANETVVLIGLQERVAFDVDATWADPRTGVRVVSLDLRRP